MTPPPSGRRNGGAQATAATGLSVVAIAGVAALVRWSLWWPHSDMRQIWATFAGVALGILGLASLVAALRGASPTERWTLVLPVTAVAALVGATAGFAILEDATASAR